MENFFQDISLLWNISIFILSGTLVWGAGIRLSKYADKIIEKTGISEVFIGTLGLAIITSLPEVATTVRLSKNLPIGFNFSLKGNSPLLT